jgi:hypothetical protein
LPAAVVMGFVVAGFLVAAVCYFDLLLAVAARVRKLCKTLSIFTNILQVFPD